MLTLPNWNDTIHAMARRTKLIIVAFIFFLAIFFPNISDAAKKEEKACTDSGCHDLLVKPSNIHPVMEGGICNPCHEKVRDKHPHKKKAFKLTKSSDELCYFCHERKYSEGYVHPPVASGDCVNCHDPHSSDQSALLLTSLPQLCYGCHDSGPFNKAEVHSIMVGGGCANCHGTHNAPKAKLLIEEGNELCLMCHPDVKTGYDQAKSKHMALESNCTDCHLPHTADVEKLLKEPMPGLCYLCHDRTSFDQVKYRHGPVVSEGYCTNCHGSHYADYDKLLFAEGSELCLSCHSSELTSADGKTIGNIGEIIEKAKNKHAALDMGGCSVCHMPHGSVNPSLLNAEYPKGNYAPYKTKSYTLCFNCHDSSAFDSGDVSGTKFKKGNVNLHYVHVNRPIKGRTCQLCHNVHAANYPHLIQEEMPFGNYQIGIEYTKRTDGSSTCLVYCHDPESYK